MPNSINAILLIQEIQAEQSKSKITDEQAFNFEQRSASLINKEKPFFYKGLEIISLQMSPFVIMGHYYKRDNCWQTIIEKLG